MSSKPSREFLERAVFLVDSSSYIFRAYYAIRQPLSAPDGTPTHATHGFVSMTNTLVDQYKPKHCVFVWDTKEKGFRHKVFPEYKANRQQPPDDMGVQIDNVRTLLDLMGYPQLIMPGFEADDIFATMIAKNPERDFVIVTGDKDLLQLVGPHVWCLDTMKNKWSNLEEAKEKFGVDPARIPFVQALSGDSVDNIPGAPGIGPKTATELVEQFGDLETVLREAKARRQNPEGKYKDALKGKRIEAIADNEEKVRMSLELVRLSPEAPVDCDYDKCLIGEPKSDELRAMLLRLGFTRLLDRYRPAASDAAPTVIAATTAADFKTHAVTDIQELRRLFESNARAPSMCLDTETFSLERMKPDNAVGFSFAFGEGEGYYVPLRHKDTNNLDVYDALKALEGYLGSRGDDFSVIFQNAKFDRHVLAGENVEWNDRLRIDDTMIMSYVLDPVEKHGMDSLAFKYLNGYKTLAFDELVAKDQNFSDVPLDQASFYAAEDAVVTMRLANRLLPRLKSEALFEVYDRLDRPLIDLLFGMERNGIGVDGDRLRSFASGLATELAELERSAHRILLDYGCTLPEEGLNFGSPKQLAEILYDQLKLPVLKKGKTGPSTDVTVLQELALQHPFPDVLLEIRELSKLLSTYIEPLPSLINPITRRLHTDFSQTVAATGRLASSNPNLQNIPIRTERGRKIRDAFIAAPGRCLVGIDYSQIELRILAHVSRDKELIRAFRENADIHRRTASLILGKPEADVTGDERRAAKTINFGIIYGQTAFGLSKQLKIGRGEAQKFIDAYNRTYPGIDIYADNAIALAREHGYSKTLTGRKRPIPDIHSKNFVMRGFAERVAVNTPIQGTAADLMKAAMLEAQRLISKKFPEAKMVLQVHDELLFELPEGAAADFEKDMVAVMESGSLLNAFDIKGFDVDMKTDAGMGKNWGEL